MQRWILALDEAITTEAKTKKRAEDLGSRRASMRENKLSAWIPPPPFPRPSLLTVARLGNILLPSYVWAHAAPADELKQVKQLQRGNVEAQAAVVATLAETMEYEVREKLSHVPQRARRPPFDHVVLCVVGGRPNHTQLVLDWKPAARGTVPLLRAFTGKPFFP